MGLPCSHAHSMHTACTMPVIYDIKTNKYRLERTCKKLQRYPLTAGPDYIRFFIFISKLNTKEMKRDSRQ